MCLVFGLFVLFSLIKDKAFVMLQHPQLGHKERKCEAKI